MYSYVCVAGTFDGLHAGHEVLLKRAFSEGARVLIGVTSDGYVSDHKQGVVRPYDVRICDLSVWLEKRGFAIRSAIVSIHDPFEPAASDPSLEALIVSAESEARGSELNRMRKALGLAPLSLVVVPMLNAEDMHPISATRVRAGVIDRVGRLLMPEALREELIKPLGRVLSGSDIQTSFQGNKARNIITVGDRTAQTILAAGITPYLMIIDNKVNREDFRELQPIFAERNIEKVVVQSGPGFISNAAIDAIQKGLVGLRQSPLVIEVNGEEDLLTIPVIMFAPLGSVVYYGQPEGVGSSSHGIVEVLVTRESQESAAALLSRFAPHTPLATAV